MMVEFSSRGSVSAESRAVNAVSNATLGLPLHEGAGRLAVVGGGCSINEHVEELRAWDGAIWAVNGTIAWCIKHGIKAYFYTMDAQPFSKWAYPLEDIKRAALSIECDPSLFAHLAGADVSVMGHEEAGPTSAAGAAVLGINAGYREICFFGCEGSFADSSHAYASPAIADWLVVRVGGQDFRSKQEYIEQTLVLSEIVREFPHVYSERSGGLLRAMIEHGTEYDIVEMSPSIWEGLRMVAA